MNNQSSIAAALPPLVSDAIPGMGDADESRSILPTLNDDGSRKWIKPRVSKGRFLTARRIVAYALIGLFAILPLLRVNGRPLILLDISARRFHILGTTFYPTDTLLLALLMVGAFLSIFWFTVVFGRVWCGWACPQTVYMEFLFRPIERLLQGAPGRAAKGWLQTAGLARPVKFLIYFACAFLLAHAFLAYFVSWQNLREWVFGSPSDHLIGFGVVAFVTVAMMLDFGYFREQVCLVMCPYGRFQSVLLDRQSMIVRYDQSRGEPRGAKSSKASVSLPVLSSDAPALKGDCIDCHMCVTTCPTGIDIRNGLQMECIGCAQCIDACDAVMVKVHRPRGLIRYSSQARMEGQKFRLLRPRVILYPAVVAVLAGLFGWVLLNTGVADVTVLRGMGQPFTLTPEGEVANGIRVKIVNRLDHPGDFNLAVSGTPGTHLKADFAAIHVATGQMLTTPVQVLAPRASFAAGRAQITITVAGPDKFSTIIPFTLLGPATAQDDSSTHARSENHP